MSIRLWTRIAVLGCALALSGCASFNRDWSQASHQAAVRRSDPFGGAWDGQWTSEKHRLPSGDAAGGRLRCLFTRIDDRHYQARFHANWLFFATGYEVVFETTKRGKVLTFQGEQNLGAIFGGIYRYQGRVTPSHFSATFASRFDHGRFEMSRPAKR